MMRMRLFSGLFAAAIALSAPAAAETATPSALLKDLAERFGARQLDRDIYARVGLGQAATSLPSLTLADLEAEAAIARSLLAELDRIPVASLSPDERLTADALRWLLLDAQTQIGDYLFTFPAPYSLFDLTFLPSALASNPLKSAADRAAYVRLLASTHVRVAAMRQRLQDQEARGIRLTKRQIPRGLSVLTDLRSRAVGWAQVPDDRLPGLSPAERAEFRAQVSKAAAPIVTAFDELIAAMQGDYLAKAPDSVGLSQYPGGREHYRTLVRRTTTMNVEPEALRDLGQRLLDANNRELDILAAKIGVPGGRAGLRDYANKNPKFIAKTADDVAARYDRCLRKIEPKIPSYFTVKPKAPYGARRLDPADEAVLTFGFYQQPTLAEPRGEYRFNGSSLENRSLITACGLIFHELVPGHHFHLALQFENEALPTFRRTASTFFAFNEGWAEYSSNLAREMGALDDPDDLLGRLIMNSMIFSRLVVDVGLNHDGWTFERAKAFMLANTFLSETEIDSEVLRYSSDIPSQALAYGAGLSAILELRREVQDALGPRFDPRRFHAEVVGHGALPLDVLRAHVRRTLIGEARQNR